MATLYELLLAHFHLTPVDLLMRQRAGLSAGDWEGISLKAEDGACFSAPSDLDAVVQSFEDAVIKDLPMVEFGDYDVDGLTSASIVFLTMKLLGVSRSGFYIPSRYDTGYGLALPILEKMVAKGYQLVIATDNGITKRRECEYLASHGVHYLILDHHEEQVGNLPKFGAGDLMYHRNDCSAAFLALLFSSRVLKDQSFLARLRATGRKVADDATIGRYLDYFQVLAGLAVFSDCMDLRNIFNLSLAKRGLNLLNRALKDPDDRLASRLAYLVDGYQPGQELKFRDINFSINSKLNSVARVAGGTIPNKGVFFLTSTDPDKVRRLAVEIDGFNRQKKEIVERAAGLVDLASSDPVLCIDLASAAVPVPSGLTGLIANRVLRTMKNPRPVLVLCPSTIDSRDCIGSLRGPEGISLDKVLESPFIKPFLKDHGGHESACGLTLPRALKDDFLHSLNAEVSKYAVAQSWATIRITEDLVSEESVRAIESLEPFGQGFELPKLSIVIDAQRLKQSMRNGNCFVNLNGGGRLLIFRCADQVARAAGEVELFGELTRNTFRGRTTVEMICDM